jgi:SAM-dependent methyltransferase
MSPLARLTDVGASLACPHCHEGLTGSAAGYQCNNKACPCAGAGPFPLAGGHPVLVDFERSVLNKADVLKFGGASTVARARRGRFRKTLRDWLFPQSRRTVANVARFLQLAKTRTTRPTILVVGGGTIGGGTEVLYNDPEIDLLAFDIYGTPQTQFIADGHQIPLKDGAVDGVLVQAVLEHVLDPWQVVAEVHRILKPDAVVYAETPFLQPVHEGPYDFTRFTESGHRYLFRRFARVDSGVVQGPGNQLLWTVDYVSRSLFRSRKVGRLMRLLFFWVQYLDRLCPEGYAVDDACGVFFLGTRSETELTAKEIIGHYQGRN